MLGKDLDGVLQNLNETLKKQTGPKANFILKEIIKNDKENYEVVVTGNHPEIVVRGFDLFKKIIAERKTGKK